MVLEQGITPCVPSQRNRSERFPSSKRLDKKRHQVENLLARLCWPGSRTGNPLPPAPTPGERWQHQEASGLKGRQPIAARPDRCAHVFSSAALLAAIVIFW